MGTTTARLTPGDGDPRHGTPNGYNNLKCRCPQCREAWRVKCAEHASKPRELPPGDPRHGTRGAYIYWHCRCDKCRSGNATGEAARRRRSKDAA